MSRSAGTGQPSWCRCAVCRSSKHALRWNEASMRGSIYRLTPTGRYKPRRSRHGGGRFSHFAFEYKCGDCGHVGWTGHKQMERKFCDAGHSLPPE